MKIVFLDQKALGTDIDLSKFYSLGDFSIYESTNDSEIEERVKDADIVIAVDCPINEETIGNAKNLKLVCIPSTGVNCLDIPYVESRNIEWRNVEAYSTNAVAQHTFSLLLYLYENMDYYNKYVINEEYINDYSCKFFDRKFHEICGKTWGIIGLGNIGKKVAEIASAFGANIIYYSTTGNNHDNRYKEVTLDELLEKSDIISIHSPLTDKTRHLLGINEFKKMKNSAYLINVARGPIIVEEDLAYALNNNLIKGAGLDVIDKEPMTESCPLRSIKDNDKLIITPHVAWIAVEARERLMNTTYNQIKDFLNR